MYKVQKCRTFCQIYRMQSIPSSPDPSTAKPITTEYNQKSLNSFWRRGLASLIGGSRLVNCESENKKHRKMYEK